MAHFGCPNCGTPLRIPDVAKPLLLRCPSCRQTFRWPRESPVCGGDEQPAANARRGRAEAERNGRRPAAVEGSGDIRARAAESRPRSGGAPKPRSPAGAPVIPREAEAAGARKGAMVAWLVAVGVTVLSAAGIWYTTWRAGARQLDQAENLRKAEVQGIIAAKDLEIERLRAAGVRAELATEYTRATELGDTLKSVVKELAAAKQEAASARQAAEEQTAGQQLLLRQLDEAKAKIAELTAEINRDKGAGPGGPAASSGQNPASVAKP